jgi:hypothetical protein
VLRKIALMLVVLATLVLGLADPLSTADPVRAEPAVYAVDGDFLIDLDAGHVTFVGVALVLAPGVAAPRRDDPDGAAEIARVRGVITGVLRGQPAQRLQRARSIVVLKRRLRLALAARAGLRVRKVVFTDLAVK